MTRINTSAHWDLANLRSWQKQSLLHGNSTWRTRQDQALEDFIEQGFPTRKIENWKYTPLTALAETEFSLKSTSDFSPEKPRSDFHRVEFYNGQFYGVSSVADLPHGVIIADLKSVIDQVKEFALPEIYKTVFSELNLATISDGVFVFIPEGVELKKPIHVIYENSADSMNSPRHIIHLASHAKAVFLSEYRAAKNSVYFNNSVEQIYLESRARLQYYKLQNEAHASFHISNMVAELQKDAYLRCCHFGKGARMSRDDINIDLQAQGAEVELYGLYTPDQNRLIDFHTRIDHVAPHSKSQQLYKTIVADKARAVFNGKVVVAQDAQKISAKQKNANLLLSRNAEVDSKPELEIYADDVQCTHGATIGQLDEVALFYLQSRGIDKLSAKKMLTDAFAKEIFELIDNEAVAEYMKFCPSCESRKDEEA